MSEFSIRTKPFRLSLADYRAFWLGSLGTVFTTFPLALTTLYFYLGMPLLVALPDMLAGNLKTYLYCQAAALALFATSSIVCFAIFWLRCRRDPVMTGERLMILDSGAVRLIGYGCDIRQNWASFSRIQQGHDHIFLYMRNSTAYVIPTRALASLDEAKRLMIAGRAAIRANRKAFAELPPLPEPPDGREIWRSAPYRMTFIMAYARLFSTLRPIVLIGCGAAALFVATGIWLNGEAGPVDAIVVTTVLLMAFLVFVSALFLPWWIIRRRPYYRNDLVFDFTRDHLRCTAAGYDGRFDWVNVRKVHRTAGVFIFRLSTGLFCVPFSAFATPAAATAFYTQAVAFWRAAEARR